jgi:hypothetical protein
MYDNRANKKNPKGPDFTCKDASCKFVQGADGSWSMSQYKTGVWEKKPFVRPDNLPANTPMVKAPEGQDGYVPTVDYAKKERERVEGMVRHGVICAMLQAGATKEQILEDYEMWTRLIIIGSPI